MSASEPDLRVLWIATKVPWPTVDGGRLLLWKSLRALHARGDVRVTLLAPTAGRPRREIAEARRRLSEICEAVLVEGSLRPRIVDAAVSLVRRRPWTLERHRNATVAEAARRLLRDASAQGDPFRVVQVEQVQALAQAPEGDGPPICLRAQNVESDLWRALGRRPATPAWLRPWLRREARLLARAEGEAVRRADLSLALTREDAGRLGELGEREVSVCRAPFEVELPAGEPLDGDPAVVLFGSAGWAPNADGARFFLRRVWPRVAERSAGAVLHVFGRLDAGEAGAAERARRHLPPRESAEALAEGSVLSVPLFVASGVRMKILEAWARGVPVVATPAAARGLDAEDGRHLLVAEEPEEMASAILRAADPAVRARLGAGGREVLARRHAPPAVAEHLVELWSALCTLPRGSHRIDPRSDPRSRTVRSPGGRHEA